MADTELSNASLENPYAPPQTVPYIDDAVVPRDAVQAGKWARFGTFVVDYATIVIMEIIVVYVLSYWGVNFREAWLSMTTPSGLPWWQHQLVWYVYTIIFYTAFEGFTAATPGKWLFGTRVVDLNGHAPDALRVLLRSLCRCIPLEAFSYFRPVPYGWHDQFSKTRVVSLRKVKAYREGTLDITLPTVTPVAELPTEYANMSEAQRAVWEMQQQQRERERVRSARSELV